MKSHNSDLLIFVKRGKDRRRIVDLKGFYFIMVTICDDSSSYKVFKLFLQSCSDLFFSYLTNRELGILDRVITDINLRKIYFQQVAIFYQTNQMKSLAELEWILTRCIIITKCHLDFDFEGKGDIDTEYTVYMHFILTSVCYNVCKQMDTIMHLCIQGSLPDIPF